MCRIVNRIFPFEFLVKIIIVYINSYQIKVAYSKLHIHCISGNEYFEYELFCGIKYQIIKYL